VYLRIVRPLPINIEGFDVTRFALHGGYDVNPPLCDLLIVAGYAIPEDPPAASRDAAIKAVAGAVVASNSAKLTDLPEEPLVPKPSANRKLVVRRHVNRSREADKS